MRACHHCHAPIDALYTIGYATVCPSCAKSLHSCINCRFYSPGSYHDCLEEVEEDIIDKMSANYCELFMLGEDTDPREQKKAEAKAKAEAFFSN